METDSALKSQDEAYIATVGTIIGVRSPRWATELRPRLRFQEYPGHAELQRTNQYLDLRSNYRSTRSRFDLNGSYSKEDRFHAELANAGFDTFDPNNPTESGSGRLLLTSETRTMFQIRPSYTYQLTQRMSIGANGLYENMRFDAPGATAGNDYDYYTLQGFLGWQVAPRTELDAGAYVGKYETGDNSYKADSTGLTLDLKHEWTQTLSATARLEVERTDLTQVRRADESTTDWGATLETQWRGQASTVRASVGRRFTPSDYGVRSTIDEVRLQYDRQLRERWAVHTALRGFQTRAQGPVTSTNDRDYVRAEFEMRWLATQTWTLSAGYNYLWQDYIRETGSADDHTVYLRIGYQGLPPQRR
jgi:hypothetical protein